MKLEPEQTDLLVSLAADALAVDRAERKFYLSLLDAGDVVRGPRGPRPVLARDIYDLIEAGLLRRGGTWVGGCEFTISAEGMEYAALEGGAQPMERVEDAIIQPFIDETAFKERYPLAYQRWGEAAALLWGGSATDELTTIGHKTRESVQEFATTLVERSGAHDIDPDPAHTVSRLRGVVDLHKDHLGTARHDLLAALITYWGEVIDLIQRQEHGGQKEGEPLSWEDARRAVFHTALVMYEVDQTIGV